MLAVITRVTVKVERTLRLVIESLQRTTGSRRRIRADIYRTRTPRRRQQEPLAQRGRAKVPVSRLTGSRSNTLLGELRRHRCKSADRCPVLPFSKGATSYRRSPFL